MATDTYIIKTSRLGMRRYVADDAPFVQAMFADTYAQQFYPSMNSLQSAESWINWNLNNYQTHGFGLFAIELPSTSQFIGDAGITYQVVEGEQVLEVGWHVQLSHRRKGYATEAARACLGYAFGTLGATLVGSIVDPLNCASIKVASRVHMGKREYQGKSGPMLFYFTHRGQYNGAAQSGSRRFLASSPHTTHRAGPQWAVQQVGSLDEVSFSPTPCNPGPCTTGL